MNRQWINFFILCFGTSLPSLTDSGTFVFLIALEEPELVEDKDEVSYEDSLESSLS